MANLARELDPAGPSRVRRRVIFRNSHCRCDPRDSAGRDPREARAILAFLDRAAPDISRSRHSRPWHRGGGSASLLKPETFSR